MGDNLDNSLNLSKKSLMCNHCMYDCKTYEHMKEHYKSDFHRYNLNRVTMKLNPLTFTEYTNKKEMYQKLHEQKNKVTTSTKNDSQANVTNLNCDICKKSFSSHNKLSEHLNSKSHKRSEEIIKSKPANELQANKTEEKEEKTTKDDVAICLFCNKFNEDMEKNLIHMINFHKFDVPLIFCVKNLKGMLRLLAKKIVTYVACLTCDNQNFKNYKSLQNHMIDKQHTRINDEDLEEFLYKFYDKKSLLSIKDKNLKKSKEFKVLKIKLNVAKILKDKKIKTKKEEDEGWETISENENEEENDQVVTTEKTKISKLLEKEIDNNQENDDDEEEYGPITLPNGELLLENGTIVGNKIYQIYYKQRIHFNKFNNLIDTVRQQRIKNIKKSKRVRPVNKKVRFYSVSGSNKSLFERVNTLFKARKQVSV